MPDWSDSQTSVSLLDVLRTEPKDAQAWSRFVRRYRPKIYGWCREWGLQGADAEDVAQDVLAKLTETMRHFKYDPSRCFRAWLKTVTQHALSDEVARRRRATRGQDAQSRAAYESRIDPRGRCDAIVDRELVDLAMARVRERVAASTWEAFRLTALEGLSGAEASRVLHMTVAAVFVSKHRVQKTLQEEIRRLEAASEGDPDH